MIISSMVMDLTSGVCQRKGEFIVFAPKEHAGLRPLGERMTVLRFRFGCVRGVTFELTTLGAKLKRIDICSLQTSPEWSLQHGQIVGIRWDRLV